MTGSVLQLGILALYQINTHLALSGSYPTSGSRRNFAIDEAQEVLLGRIEKREAKSRAKSLLSGHVHGSRILQYSLVCSPKKAKRLACFFAFAADP